MRIMGVRCCRRDDESERGEKANQLRDSQRGGFHLTRYIRKFVFNCEHFFVYSGLDVS